MHKLFPVYERSWINLHSRDMHTWFRPDEFDWSYIKLLIQFCGKQRDLWLKHVPDGLLIDEAFLLIKYGSEYLEDWWDFDMIEEGGDRDEPVYIEYLMLYAPGKIDIWYDQKYFMKTKSELIVSMLYE